MEVAREPYLKFWFIYHDPQFDEYGDTNEFCSKGELEQRIQIALERGCTIKTVKLMPDEKNEKHSDL